MTKQLIFIDDSGDPGFKIGSSSIFVMAAAVFGDLNMAGMLSNEIARYRDSLGWRSDYEFKFAKIRKDIVVELLKLVSKYDYKGIIIFNTYL